MKKCETDNTFHVENNGKRLLSFAENPPWTTIITLAYELWNATNLQTYFDENSHCCHVDTMTSLKYHSRDIHLKKNIMLFRERM